MNLKVLVACEESQTVTKEFRKLGHEAFSCDLVPCSGGYPEWHIQGDVTPLLKQKWDIIIAHPPCTYLSVSGAKWFYHPDDKGLSKEQRRPHPKYPNRAKDRQAAIDFFMRFVKIPAENCLFIAIENPISIMSTVWQKPTQIIQPWQFGHGETKATCLWLRNLKKLEPTNIVSGREGKVHNLPPSKDRAKLRSTTYEGIAKAMAEQWSKQVVNYKTSYNRLKPLFDESTDIL